MRVNFQARPNRQCLLSNRCNPGASVESAESHGWRVSHVDLVECLSGPSGACLLSDLELPKKTAHAHANYPARPDLLSILRKLGASVESVNTTVKEQTHDD